MAGTLDTTFNNPNGFITKQFTPEKDTTGYSIAIDSSDRAIVTGRTMDDSGMYNMFITRYLKNGNLDTTFGSNGVIIKNYGINATGQSVVIDSSSRILVTGNTNTTVDTSSMFITRYLTNGTVDTNFGNGGVIIKKYKPGIITIGYSTVIDSRDRILVTGFTAGYTDPANIFITRYLTNGTLDTTFGDDGVVIEKRINNNPSYNNIAIDNTGRIVITGTTNNLNMFIFRYLSNGTPDTSFADDGIIIKNYNGKDTFGNSVAIDSSGRIVITGNTGDNTVDNTNIPSMFVTRYLPDGTLDTSFAGGVIIKQYKTGYITAGQSVIIDSSGRIVLTGFTYDNNDIASMFITRYFENGKLDTGFGNSGVSIKQFIPGLNVGGISLAIDSTDNDNILVTGGGVDPVDNKNYMFIARYLSENNEPICLVAGTPILTDQGFVPIEKIDTKKHTISKKRIVAITTTITPEKHLVCFEANSMGINCPTVRTVMTPGHEVLYNGKLVQAKHFVGRVEGVHTVPYNGRDVLYNVLMEQHGLMRVNNMVLETLHPENKVAKQILGKI